MEHLTLLIIMRNNDYERSGRRRRGRAKGKQQQAELSCLLPSCPAAAFLLPCLAQHSLVYNNRGCESAAPGSAWG